MKNNQSSNQVRKSTYALLMRSEEKEKNLFETLACGVFVLSAVAAIVQFASQPVKLPVDSVRTASSMPQVEVLERA
ncbi:MAG TPA: hypothetical protein VJS88_06305 [Chthoniobacterales bacterium]|nr:hypothetical protein [Chthoniobacterales bacterium]